MQLIKSPFAFIGRTKLGKIYRPYIIVSFYSKLIDRWLPVEMVVDSGADYTLLPNRYASILGIDFESDCSKEKTQGVGGTEMVYQYPKLPLRVNKWEKKIPVGFLSRDDIPALLGRLGCLEVLRVTFEKLSTSLELIDRIGV